MTRWYLSGPISSYANTPKRRAAQEAARLQRFHDAAAAMRARGLLVACNPAELIADPEAGWRDYMRACIRCLVTDCTAVATLPGWHESRGAQIEVALARDLGMLVVPIGEALKA